MDTTKIDITLVGFIGVENDGHGNKTYLATYGHEELPQGIARKLYAAKFACDREMSKAKAKRNLAYREALAVLARHLAKTSRPWVW